MYIHRYLSGRIAGVTKALHQIQLDTVLHIGCQFLHGLGAQRVFQGQLTRDLHGRGARSQGEAVTFEFASFWRAAKGHIRQNIAAAIELTIDFVDHLFIGHVSRIKLNHAVFCQRALCVGR